MTPQEQARYQQILRGLSQSASGLKTYLNNSPYSGAASTTANTLGGLNDASNVYSGIQRGGASGYGNAALGAGRLAGRAGLLGGSNSAANQGVGDAANALAIYNGIKQGGVSGYGNAAVNAAQLGSRAGLLPGAVGTAAGYVAAPLAVYNAVKNWQSGATGSDALQGAEAGAAVGSIIPGVGTLIGAVVGGLIGAGSSAFGGGRHDVESDNWQQYVPQANQNSALTQLMSPAANYENLAGVMDAKNNTPGHSQPIEQVFGRMGENNLLNQMGQQINDAVKSGKINANSDADTIYNSVVTPWLQSKGAGIVNQNTAKGDPEGAALNSTLKNLTSQYVSGQITPTTALGLEGQTDSALTPFVGFNKLSPADEVAQANAYTRSLGRDTSPVGSPAPVAAPLRTNPGGWNIAGTTPAITHVTTPTIPPAIMGHSEGGSMRRRKRYDDGGDVNWGDFDYSSIDTGGDSGGSDYQQPSFTPGTFTDYNSIASGGSGAPPQLGSDVQAGLDQNQQAIDDLGKALSQYESQNNLGGSGGSRGSGSSLAAALAALKGKATGQQGISGYLQLLSGLMPIVGALTGPKTNTSAPSPFAGMTQGAKPPPAPGFNRSQVAAPSNTGAPMTQQDWYTYGSRPEASFFSNNSVPLAQATGVAHAKGGALSHLQDEGGYGMPEFDSAVEHHVNGPGDGTSDDIPAKLSDGEYVMDANTVSMLGNGSNKAGAARLDALRQNLRKHAAKSMTKGKQFMKAKPPEAYMKGGAKK